MWLLAVGAVVPIGIGAAVREDDVGSARSEPCERCEQGGAQARVLVAAEAVEEHEQRSRRDERHQAVLVEGQLLHVSIEFREGSIEPVGKDRIDALHRFAHGASTWRRAATARL